MAGFSFCTPCLLLSFAAFLLASDSERTRVPRSHRVAGVFLLIEGGEYTFDSGAAEAACRILNVAIATRAQVERAQRRGLEMCKFGWIAEQIAVVPRLTADKNCGQGATGVVKWRAKLDQKFGVFCFNASDFVETPNGSTAGAESSPLPTTVPPRPEPGGPSRASATKPPPSMAPTSTNAPERTAFPPAITPLVGTTHSTRISTTYPPPKPSSTHVPTSLSPLRTSKPSAIALTFLPSARAFSFSLSAESATPQPTSSATPSSGNTVATALIVLGSIVAVAIVAVLLVRYYKLNVFTYWPRGPQRDDTETEMWKHGDGETDLYSGHEGEEEESDRKYSSDITLCVNPDFRTNTSQ
ncbi:lymphatic vessel endothelial hyaluronic receptor 1b isoform X1 [Gasterosteus aculeatus]